MGLRFRQAELVRRVSKGRNGALAGRIAAHCSTAPPSGWSSGLSRQGPLRLVQWDLLGAGLARMDRRKAIVGGRVMESVGALGGRVNVK